MRSLSFDPLVESVCLRANRKNMTRCIKRLAVLAILIFQMAWINQSTTYTAAKRVLTTNGIPAVATTTTKYGAEDYYPSTHYDTIDSYSAAILSEGYSVNQSRSQKLSQSPPPLRKATYCNATFKLGPIQFTSYPSRHKLSDFLEGPGLSSFVDMDDPSISKFSMMMRMLEDKKKEKRQQKQKQHQLVIRGGGRLNISYPIDSHVKHVDASTSTTNVDDDDDEEEEAVCLYVKSRINPSHFPHTMQQLYRCWSWWQVNNNDQSGRSRRRRHPVLEFPDEIKQIKDITHDNNFNYGFFKFLKKYANVTIRRRSSTTSSGYDQRDGSNETKHEQLHARPHKLVVQPKNFQHSDHPYQGYSPNHFHALRDVFIKGVMATTTTGRKDDHYQQGDKSIQSPEVKRDSKTPATSETVPVASSWSSRRPRIVILNRNSTRKLLNDQEVLHAVYMQMKEYYTQNHSKSHTAADEDDAYEPNIRAVYFDGNAEMSFQEQIETLYNTDVLISPHGAALTGIPFLPNCASVLEIFPLGLQFDEFFGTLAAATNVEHAYVYLTNGDTDHDHELEIRRGMRSGESRAECRAANLCPPIQDLVDGIMTVVKRWEARCVSRKEG